MSIQEYYKNYDEDERLFKDAAHRVEYDTTIAVLEKYLTEGISLLDIGAGTGNYSYYYKQKGLHVTALEYSDANVQILKSKNDRLDEANKIRIEQGDARNLDIFSDNSFEAVICMGPIYHLGDREDKLKCIEECRRVLKPGGTLAVAYLNRQAMYLRSLMTSVSNIDDVDVNLLLDKEKVTEGVFKFDSPEYMEDLLTECHLNIRQNVSTDGISYIMADKINAYSHEQYKKFLHNHLLTCDEKHILGYSLHGLIIARK